MDKVWIVSVGWEYEEGEIMAVCDNKKTATTIMNRTTKGDTQYIDEFPLLTTVKDYKEKT